jgi:hypothetical protein
MTSTMDPRFLSDNSIIRANWGRQQGSCKSGRRKSPSMSRMLWMLFRARLMARFAAIKLLPSEGMPLAIKDRLQRRLIASLIDVRAKSAKLLDARAAVRQCRQGRVDGLHRCCATFSRETSALATGGSSARCRGRPPARLPGVLPNRRFAPFEICSLKCFVYAAHSSLSFKESAESATG